MGVVPVTVFAQWEFRILLARRTMCMGTLCAMETIHLLDRQRTRSRIAKRDISEKPIADVRAAILLDHHPRKRAPMSGIGIAIGIEIQRYTIHVARCFPVFRPQIRERTGYSGICHMYIYNCRFGFSLLKYRKNRESLLSRLYFVIFLSRCVIRGITLL